MWKIATIGKINFIITAQTEMTYTRIFSSVMLLFLGERREDYFVEK